MKKIILAAVVVLAAVYCQAASFKWSASGVQNYAGTEALSGAATLYAYLSTADESTAVAVNTATMTTGAISAADTVFSDDSLEAPNVYKFYYKVTDAAGNVFTSGTKGLKAQATATGALSFAATGTWTGATPGGAPEPTSGLLLLLGMAGLALKRKVA